jgi:hypothetical protein
MGWIEGQGGLMNIGMGLHTSGMYTWVLGAYGCMGVGVELVLPTLNANPTSLVIPCKFFWV